MSALSTDLPEEAEEISADDFLGGGVVVAAAGEAVSERQQAGRCVEFLDDDVGGNSFRARQTQVFFGVGLHVLEILLDVNGLEAVVGAEGNMVNAADVDGVVKVVDFGLAKLTEVSGGGASISGATMSPTSMGTVAGAVMGTAGYMAPEQVDGRQVDGRTDTFAFGCLLYEMASGTKPFDGESLHDTLHRIGHAEPTALAQLDSSLPAELQRIVGKCLTKDPAGRYQHADDLVIDLRSLALEVEKGTAVPLAAVSSGISGVGPVEAPAAAPAAWWRSPAATAALIVVGGIGGCPGDEYNQPVDVKIHPGLSIRLHRLKNLRVEHFVKVPGRLHWVLAPQVDVVVGISGHRGLRIFRIGSETQANPNFQAGAPSTAVPAI